MTSAHPVSFLLQVKQPVFDTLHFSLHFIKCYSEAFFSENRVKCSLKDETVGKCFNVI